MLLPHKAPSGWLCFYVVVSGRQQNLMGQMVPFPKALATSLLKIILSGSLGRQWVGDATGLSGLTERFAAIDKWAEKPAFGTPLEEHLKRSGREIALPIEACVMLLLETGMKEEVRAPWASVTPHPHPCTRLRHTVPSGGAEQ